jgi:hypothetical protein
VRIAPHTRQVSSSNLAVMMAVMAGGEAGAVDESKAHIDSSTARQL